MKVHSIQSPQNRTQEQALVNIIMNLFVLQNQGDLTSSETITFSRNINYIEILLHL
jgi:hypothetical protein